MKYLIIIPHPDDETYFISGLIQKLKRLNNDIRIVILTKGGAGKNYLSKLEMQKIKNANLKEIRTEEFEKAMKLLRVIDYEIYDFEDGKLNNLPSHINRGHLPKRKDLQNTIVNEIEDFQPDSVITYDNTGVTGHPDHIAVSEIIYNLQKSDKYFF